MRRFIARVLNAVAIALSFALLIRHTYSPYVEQLSDPLTFWGIVCLPISAAISEFILFITRFFDKKLSSVLIGFVDGLAAAGIFLYAFVVYLLLSLFR